MSLLTLSGDFRQNETFKEKSDIFARIFTKQWIKIYFSPNRMLTTWRGIARARSCHALQRGHLCLINYFVLVHSHKQIIVSVYEDINVH